MLRVEWGQVYDQGPIGDRPKGDNLKLNGEEPSMNRVQDDFSDIALYQKQPCCPHVRQAVALPPHHSTFPQGWSAGGAARQS